MCMRYFRKAYNIKPPAHIIKLFVFIVAVISSIQQPLHTNPNPDDPHTQKKQKKNHPKIDPQFAIAMIRARQKNMMRHKMFAALAHKRLVFPNMLWRKTNALKKIVNNKHYAKWLQASMKMYKETHIKTFFNTFSGILRKKILKGHKIALLNNGISKLHEDSEIFQITAFQMSLLLQKKSTKEFEAFKAFEKKQRFKHKKMLEFLQKLLRKI